MANPETISEMDALTNTKTSSSTTTYQKLNNLSTSYYSSLYYNMEKRGLAIIFNHYEYMPDGKYTVPKREGTNVDASRIKQCLKNLNFKVKSYNDPTVKEIGHILDEVAHLKSTDISCLVVVVMTHGDPGILRAYNHEYKVELLWEGLTATACPALVGIPKLYFIQACRGRKLDAGQSYTDAIGSNDFNYKIPSMADFLHMYSTYADHSSWREQDGTWFIQSLCQILEDVGTHHDLMQLLTFVNHKVAFEYESHTLDVTTNRMKQIPQIVSMLTKLLVFKKSAKQY